MNLDLDLIKEDLADNYNIYAGIEKFNCMKEDIENLVKHIEYIRNTGESSK